MDGLSVRYSKYIVIEIQELYLLTGAHHYLYIQTIQGRQTGLIQSASAFIF